MVLISVPSSQAAIDLIDQTRDLCSKGGLIFHKFVTNNDNVSQHLNISDSPEVKLPDSACTIQHALAVIWDVASDIFKFEFKPKQARETYFPLLLLSMVRQDHISSSFAWQTFTPGGV